MFIALFSALYRAYGYTIMIIRGIGLFGGEYENRTRVHGFAIGQHQYIAIYNSILKII